MALLLKAGDRFPDLTLSNEDGAATSLAQVADGRPLLLSFYRGPW